MNSYSHDLSWYSICTKPAAAPPSFVGLLAALERLPPPEPRQTMYVREIPAAVAELPAGEGGGLYSSLYGFPIVVRDWLPETVKDRDGNDVELVAILASELGPHMSLEQTAARMVFMTGKVVRWYREP